MTISVLMYHALYKDSAELESIPLEERPYSISIDDFKSQLDLLRDNSIDVISPDKFLNLEINEKNTNSVLLTFDDGHSSFYKYAYPELLRFEIKAIFFITSDLIKNRNDFCSWAQLKEMHENGMSIQAHGKTHQFISDLSDAESHSELYESKVEIERHVFNKVDSMSFPGGRYSNRDRISAIEIGYRFLFTSREGLNNYNECVKTNIVKRFALRKSTTLEQFKKLSNGDGFEINKRIFITFLKAVVKKIIGNNVYHFIYKRHRSN